LNKRKKKLFFYILVISMLYLLYLTSQWHILPYNIKQIDIYKATSFEIDNINDNNLVVSLKGKSIKTVTSSINAAGKMQGQMDVRFPDYIVNVVYKNGTVKTSYLWLDDSDGKGMWMNSTDTGTGYSISNTQKLQKIILQTKYM